MAVFCSDTAPSGGPGRDVPTSASYPNAVSYPRELPISAAYTDCTTSQSTHMPSQLPSLPLSLIKDTRTRTNHHDDQNDHQQHKTWFGGARRGGPILPVYKTKRRRSGGAGGAGVRRENTLWSPYYAPRRRRSKRLVIWWLGAFFVAGLITWWVMSSWRRAEGNAVVAEVLKLEAVPEVDA